MQIHGSCHCGAITFTANIDPQRVTVCHCSDCQALSGAPMRAICVLRWGRIFGCVRMVRLCCCPTWIPWSPRQP